MAIKVLVVSRAKKCQLSRQNLAGSNQHRHLGNAVLGNTAQTTVRKRDNLTILDQDVVRIKREATRLQVAGRRNWR